MMPNKMPNNVAMTNAEGIICCHMVPYTSVSMEAEGHLMTPRIAKRLPVSQTRSRPSTKPEPQHPPIYTLW